MADSLPPAADPRLAPPSFPGAVEPERERTVRSLGIGIHVAEWGDPDAEPVLLCHGFWDHVRSFALLAPLLARRYRVVAMDARGHGDSDWAGAYSWTTWVTDIVHVLRDLGRPALLVGHSMSGGQTTDAARAAPELVRKLVNIDGFGPPPEDPQRPAKLAELTCYLNYRRRLGRQRDWNPYPSLDDLVRRRREQNPRLTEDWLRYFLFWGARRDADGWRWKSDPQMAAGAGPWRPDWIGPGFATLRMPLLAVVGSEADTWGPLPERILAERLRHAPQLERATVAGAGHFVHIEQPAATARVIEDFFAA